MRGRTELIKRYAFFLVGIFNNALGVALITKSLLGTGPTVVIPYVASLRFPVSLGVMTFAFNCLLLLLQFIMLGKNFKIIQLLQLPVTFVYSVFLDVAMLFLSFISEPKYFFAILLVLVGCVFRGLGISLQVLADVVMLPSEAFVKVLSDTTKSNFSVCKLISDALMCVIAMALSIYFFGSVTGVREGTIITVLLVAPISHYFTGKLHFTNHYFENQGEFVYEHEFKLIEGKPLVITITSETGSGGRVIGKILAEKLNIPAYDKELIPIIAERGHLSADFVKKHNERLYTNALEEFLYENYNITEDNMEQYRMLYESQKAAILELAKNQDCIIMGHCSNYILRDLDSCLHIHICANMKSRVAFMMEKYKVNARRATQMITKQDHDMSKYYQHFTGMDWKMANQYHMTIDSTLFGLDGTAEMLKHIVKSNYMDIPKINVTEAIRKYQLDKQQ